MKCSFFQVLLGVTGLALCHIATAKPSLTDPDAFYRDVMNVAPYLPETPITRALDCALQPTGDSQHYLTAGDVGYDQSGWHKRVSADWDFFSETQELGRITVIDYRLNEQQQLGYRYLANGTQHELYEPWSSSKILAYVGAMAKARQQGVGGTARLGDALIADMITSINSYEPTGAVSGDSNAIATFFANVAGRDYLTALFHDQWLRVANPDVRFRGAYGPIAYEPSKLQWADGQRQSLVATYPSAYDDPGYQAYRCEKCGLTGNKPMTTLAQAEWLKRLASHTREPLTQQPYLQTEDVEILFYGEDGKGGMMAGISQMVAIAIAQALAPYSDDAPNVILDRSTQGQWRIFQKIGWGPSETRGAGENVVLAHVCLPHVDGGREFTLAAQAAQTGNGEIFVGYSGLKMQHLLNRSMRALLISNR